MTTARLYNAAKAQQVDGKKMILELSNGQRFEWFNPIGAGCLHHLDDLVGYFLVNICFHVVSLLLCLTSQTPRGVSAPVTGPHQWVILAFLLQVLLRFLPDVLPVVRRRLRPLQS